MVVLASAIFIAGATARPASMQAARAAEVRKPNIIVVVADDQSIASLRYPIMPYFRSTLADPRERWTTFSHAFDNNPLCCPARATILTGQYSHHNGVWCVERGPHCGEALNERHTMATWLHTAGYRTGLFGKYLNYYPFDRGYYIPRGWDQWHAFLGSGGGTYYNYKMYENGRVTSYGVAPEDHSTVVVGTEASRFVSRARQPFFAYIATSSPHQYWTAEPAHQGAYDGQAVWHSPAFNEPDVSDKPRWVRDLPEVNPAAADRDQRSELASLLDVDSMLQQVFTAAQNRGVWGRTVVLYISDNGYSYGAHRWEGKRCPYDECIRVPMFVRDPFGGITHTSPKLVSNVDVAPTVAQFAHVSPDMRQDGVSLVPLLKEQSVKWTQNTGLLLEYRSDGGVPSWWGVRTPTFFYDEIATGERELYDLSRDPYERLNVARSVSYRKVRARMHCKLRALRGLSC
jgi:arylsulfatase A-like enzyme